jgi:hypothetical protein
VVAEKSSGRLLLPLPSSSASSHGIFLSDLINQQILQLSPKLLAKEPEKNTELRQEYSSTAHLLQHVPTHLTRFFFFFLFSGLGSAWGYWPNSFWRRFAKFRLKQQV